MIGNAITKNKHIPNSARTRLSSFKNAYHYEIQQAEPKNVNYSSNYFCTLVSNAGYGLDWKRFLCICVLTSMSCLVFGLMLNFYLSIFFAFVGFYLPIAFMKNKSKERARLFSSEYPSVLLAMASNMKAGLTVYSSLERAIMLLPETSEVKREVKIFLEKIARGVTKDVAVSQFATSIELQELELFRRAFSLVMVHGGKFSRTLERLAQVCRDRENLIKASKVSTASMRMTSNVLLVVAPTLVLLMSAKNKNYWQILFNNNTAFFVAIVGVTTIVSSIIILRRMSDFKP